MPGKKYVDRKKKILHASAKLFMEKGYTHTTMVEISRETGIEKTAVVRAFSSKENILAELVRYVLEGQFAAAEKFLDGVTTDKILYYAAETTLQLYITESNEQIRDLYLTAYSMPNASSVIRDAVTEKLEWIFKEHLPELKKADFYELEIASGSIIRGFMAIPCGETFPMERKVNRYLETALRIYQVPEEKIREAIAFVSQFDYEKLAQQTIGQMLKHLEEVI